MMTDQAIRRRRVVCVALAMALPTLASLVYYVWLAGTMTASIVYGVTKLFTVVWPVAAVVGFERQRLALGRIDWRKHLAALPLGLATGLGIGVIMLAAVALTPAGDYLRDHAGDLAAKVEQVGLTNPARYIGFCVFLSGLHSLIEEFFWRWYVFGRLATMVPVAIAYPLAGLSFAGHHYVVLGCYFSTTGAVVFGTCVGIGGVLWCWMLRRQTTLTGCWLSHAIVDAVVFAIGYQLVFGSATTG